MRAQLDSQWRDLQPVIANMVLKTAALLNSTEDFPRPIFVRDIERFEQARLAFREHVMDALGDFLADVLGPLRQRADEAGIDPDTYMPDLSPLMEGDSAHPDPVKQKEAA